MWLNNNTINKNTINNVNNQVNKKELYTDICINARDGVSGCRDCCSNNYLNNYNNCLSRCMNN
jgi:hypothetical protein